jgi:autotransporter-associated beta strand protein
LSKRLAEVTTIHPQNAQPSEPAQHPTAVADRLDALIVQIGRRGATALALAFPDQDAQRIINHGPLVVANPLDQSYSNKSSGIGAVITMGAGKLSLSQINSYTGHTTIVFGTLAIVAFGSISSSALITISNGAGLDATGRTGQTLTINSGKALSGSGTILGKLNAVGGGNHLSWRCHRDIDRPKQYHLERNAGDGAQPHQLAGLRPTGFNWRNYHRRGHLDRVQSRSFAASWGCLPDLRCASQRIHDGEVAIVAGKLCLEEQSGD